MQHSVDVDTGLIHPARRIESPNRDQRPEGVEIDLLVIHGISLPPGEFGGGWIDALFTNRLDPEDHPYFREIQGLTVSSHLLIRRDGELVQFVPFHLRAWHAGVSSWQGRERCNDFAIGVELEGTDEVPYTTPQYRRLAAVTLALRAAYPAISDERIVGHCDIAPGRKTDPGASFDWDRFRAAVAGDVPRVE